MEHSTIVSFSEALIEQQDFADIEHFYENDKVSAILIAVLDFLTFQKTSRQKTALPNAELEEFLFTKPCELEIYVTDSVEGQELNLEARGKDYATNILSYPSDLPESVMEILPSLPLGELVICHAVVVSQADEQGKTVREHLTHLIVHGILHLLGFDHELGQAEQDEMESLEIEILRGLGIENPYE